MSDIPPVRVLCKRPHGFSFMHEGKIHRLEYGINEGVDRVAIWSWLVNHGHLKIATNGTIMILDASVSGEAAP